MAVYNPKKSNTLGGLAEVMSHMENRYCISCRFREDDGLLPMCDEVSNSLLSLEPHPMVIDYQKNGVACKRWTH